MAFTAGIPPTLCPIHIFPIQKRAYVIRRNRAANEIPLYLIAVLQRQEFQLCFLLDSLSNYFYSQRMSKSDHSTHYRLSLFTPEQIVNKAPVLMADEPTGNLDSKTSAEIMKLFKKINEEEGTTILLVTHEPDVAVYAKRIVHFKDGMITSDEPNRTVKKP